jgi:hypothetical protein
VSDPADSGDGRDLAPADRLAALSEADFYALLGDLAAARWGESEGWTVDLSPPSPRSGIDVVLEGDGERRLLHVRQYPQSRAVGAPDVREVAALRDPRNLDRVALATTSSFSGAAREAARERSVRLVGPGELVEWAESAGVELPRPSPGSGTDVDSDSDPHSDSRRAAGRERARGRERGRERGDDPADASVPERAAGRYAGYWPAALGERALEVVGALDDLGDFDYEVRHADASTELRCRAGERVPVRVRFTETSFLVFVAAEGRPEPVVRLTAYRERQPPVSDLLAELRPAVERALDG